MTMSTIAALQLRKVPRTRRWQVLVVAAVLIAGFALGVFVGRVTATSTASVAGSRSGPAATAPEIGHVGPLSPSARGLIERIHRREGSSSRLGPAPISPSARHLIERMHR
jgi:hypothetical protein